VPIFSLVHGRKSVRGTRTVRRDILPLRVKTATASVHYCQVASQLSVGRCRQYSRRTRGWNQETSAATPWELLKSLAVLTRSGKIPVSLSWYRERIYDHEQAKNIGTSPSSSSCNLQLS